MAKTQTQTWRDQAGLFLFAFAFVAIAVTCLSIYWTQTAAGTEAQTGEESEVWRKRSGSGWLGVLVPHSKQVFNILPPGSHPSGQRYLCSKKIGLPGFLNCSIPGPSTGGIESLARAIRESPLQPLSLSSSSCKVKSGISISIGYFPRSRSVFPVG